MKHEIVLEMRNVYAFASVRRYRSYCPQCRWTGEYRRSEDLARQDGRLHEAAPGKAAA